MASLLQKLLRCLKPPSLKQPIRKDGGRYRNNLLLKPPPTDKVGLKTNDEAAAHFTFSIKGRNIIRK
jgi:hypothetical protein